MALLPQEPWGGELSEGAEHFEGWGHVGLKLLRWLGVVERVGS